MITLKEYYYYFIITILKCDHIKKLMTLTCDYIKRFSAYLKSVLEIFQRTTRNLDISERAITGDELKQLCVCYILIN